MSAVSPVTAICAATATPCQPPTIAMTVISEYQKTPSPRRLMAPKKMPMARRAPQRLAATHMRRSRLALRGDGGAALMDILLGKGPHDGFEVADDRFGREAGHRGAGGMSHGRAYRGIRAQGGSAFDEPTLVTRSDTNAVLPVANELARGGFGVSDDGDARRHRLEYDIAEGFGKAREDKE